MYLTQLHRKKNSIISPEQKIQKFLAKLRMLDKGLSGRDKNKHTR